MIPRRGFRGIIVATLQKELTEYRRDGRVLAVGGLIVCLLLVSLITGWATHAEQQRQARQSQSDDQSTFLRQGEKSPHSAAHFGRMAYKPIAALAIFDPGTAPYLGQVVWLEAHRQDPAMFRPAEDSPELRRLADLSVAGILAILLPLLIFLMSHGAFAAERERGTLRHVMSIGTDGGKLFVGKLIAVAGVGIGLSLIAVVVSTVLALLSPAAVSPWDTLGRGVALFVCYAAYSLMLAAVALLVSARARTGTSALLILLSAWAVSVVLVPRIAAALAEHRYPTPDSSVFWSQAASRIRETRPKRSSQEYRDLERSVLARALGRDVGSEEVASAAVNRRGIHLEVGELLDARAYANAYRALYETYEKQHRMRNMFSVLSPVMALQHASASLAGTDIAAHRHFALEAERQRNLIIRAMNEDMMLNGAQQGDTYVAGAALWQRVPDFAYRPPSLLLALRSARWDFAMLGLWCVVAVCLAWPASSRQKIA